MLCRWNSENISKINFLEKIPVFGMKFSARIMKKTCAQIICNEKNQSDNTYHNRYDQLPFKK